MAARIYIGRLNYDVRERDLERFFKGYGRITEILLKNGFGFVEFDDFRDADDAVYDLNGKEFFGERVTVEHARGLPRGRDMYNSRNRSYRNFQPYHGRRSDGRSGGGRSKYGPPTRTDYRLIVENLSSRVNWQDLKDYMRQAGEVTYVDAHKQRRNEGVVEFASYSDMKNAIKKLDETELNGRKIRLVEDKSRSSLRRSPSRSRSRSRRRSRNRHSSYSDSRSKSRSRSKSHSRSGSPSSSKKGKSSSPSSIRSGNKDRKDSRSPSKSDLGSPKNQSPEVIKEPEEVSKELEEVNKEPEEESKEPMEVSKEPMEVSKEPMEVSKEEEEVSTG